MFPITENVIEDTAEREDVNSAHLQSIDNRIKSHFFFIFFDFYLTRLPVGLMKTVSSGRKSYILPKYTNRKKFVIIQTHVYNDPYMPTFYPLHNTTLIWKKLIWK